MKSLLPLLAVILVAAGCDDGERLATPRAAVALPSPEVSSDAILAEAFQDRTSNLVVEGRGVVVRILPDDKDGSRHQRFILRLDSGQTLLVSHNIDLAPRIESLARGETVWFRGEYEWNAQGGVIHWTHHDPAGRRPGGWLKHAGRIYR